MTKEEIIIEEDMEEEEEEEEDDDPKLMMPHMWREWISNQFYLIQKIMRKDEEGIGQRDDPERIIEGKSRREEES